MHHHVMIFITLHIIVNVIFCSAIGISSKLDFGSPTKGIVESPTKSKISYTVHKDESEDKGVVCASKDGCNDTANSKDTIQTDVVVHVKTKVEIDEKRNKNVTDDIPDIPIVIGTGSNHAIAEDPNVIQPLVIAKTPDVVVPQFPRLFDEEFSEPRLKIESLSSGKEFAEPQINLKVNNEDKYNAFALKVPHFESSYHRHYYGENPPPQVVWFPKSAKPTAKPLIWTPTTHRYHLAGGVTCTCKNEVPTGLQWYPSRSRALNPGYQHHGSFKPSPGQQINDKLAPLN